MCNQGWRRNLGFLHTNDRLLAYQMMSFLRNMGGSTLYRNNGTTVVVVTLSSPEQQSSLHGGKTTSNLVPRAPSWLTDSIQILNQWLAFARLLELIVLELDCGLLLIACVPDA